MSNLDSKALRAELGEGLWTSVTVVPSTGSTNADLLAAGGASGAAGGAEGAAGGAEGTVLAAEEQTAGRGRLGRSWVSRPGAALTFSVLLRPESVPAERRGWLPLLAGVSVARSVRAVAGLPATLKWPNDVLVHDRKLAGILAEQAADGAVVIGIGVNVSEEPDALPSGAGGLRGTSIAAEGGKPDRQRLLAEILRQLEQHYTAFRGNPDPEATGVGAEYQTLCATLGRQVRAELPDGAALTGEATAVDADGRLLITARGTTTPLSAGDVVHLR